MPKTAGRYENEPPCTMGNRSPTLVWMSVLRPLTKKMVEITCPVCSVVAPIAGHISAGMRIVAPNIVK